MILDRDNYAYETMYEAIKSFIELNTKSSKDVKSAQYNYRKELTDIFKDINPISITKENLLSIIGDNHITVITSRFLSFLCKNGYVDKNNSLMFLSHYEILFSKSCQKERFEYFLSIDNYLLKQFLIVHPTLGKCEISVIQLNIENIPFVDSDIKSLLSQYINELKINDAFKSAGSLQNKITEIIHICDNFLSKHKKEEIDCNAISNCLSEKWIRGNTMIEMNKILLLLIENGLIISDDLNNIVTIKESAPALTLEKYQEMLTSNDIQGYFIRDRKGITKRVFYARVDSVEILDALKGYAIQSTESSSEFSTFLSEFNNSIDGLNINSISDLSLESFVHQIEYYKPFNQRNIYSFVTGFYAYIVNNIDPDILKDDGLSGRIFQKNALGNLLVNGYEIIKYNPIEEVPNADKWIFCYSSKDETNSMVSTSNSQCIDFTVIKNKTYRDWYKYYVWKNDTSLYTRLHAISPITVFFNYIHDLKKGKELSVYSKKTNDVAITLNEVIAYKNYVINTYENNRTRSSHIYAPRVILKFIHNDGLVEIPNGVYYYLTHKLDSNYDNTKAVPDEHLKKLSELMKENSDKDVDSAVFYLAFYIALETEFRSSQLFSLKADCVVETAKKGEYVLVSKTKTSANEEIEQPITIYVKKHIDEILKLTKEYRENSIVSDISTYLFITTGSRKGTYKILNSQTFNGYLGKCCDKLGLPKYTYNNLRDTHMTKSEEFIIRNQMSDMEKGILSGHRSPDTDTKHYIDTQIKDLLESVHGVIIGNIDVAGHIKESLPDNITRKENSVSNNCGYCGCKSCSDFSFLDCMLCKDFVTTIDRLPYFEEQVKILDEKIKNATIPHDKEDLVNMKRLHLGFINKILEIKSKKGQEDNASK